MQYLQRLFTRRRSFWWEYAIAILCYTGVLALCTRLFYFEIKGILEGDLNAQVQVAIGPPGSVGSYVPVYSLYKYVFRFLNWIWPNDWIFVFFELGIVLAGCLVTGRYIHNFSFCKNPALTALFGLGLYCADPIFLPMFNPYRAMGLQAGGLWHNPTLLGIKLLGVVLLWLFARISPQIARQAPGKLLACFAFAGLIATWIKPNLILCIYPALAVLLLIWLKQAGGRAFWRLAAFAATVLPSMGILLWQYLLTYGESSVQESGIGILFGYSITLFAENPVMSILQSMAFPLAVLAVCWRALKRLDSYCLAWIATGFAYLQYLFLIETGPRMTHGNWDWGVCVMAFLLFVVSFEELLRQMADQWNGNAWGKVWVCCCWGLLGWHVICGVIFLITNLTQGSYFSR